MIVANGTSSVPLPNVAKEIAFAVNEITRGIVARNDDINMLRSQLTSSVRGGNTGQRSSILNERSRIVLTKACANELERQ